MIDDVTTSDPLFVARLTAGRATRPEADTATEANSPATVNPDAATGVGAAARVATAPLPDTVSAPTKGLSGRCTCSDAEVTLTDPVPETVPERTTDPPPATDSAFAPVVSAPVNESVEPAATETVVASASATGAATTWLPAFRTWKRPDGYTSVDIQSDEIGRRSAVDLTLGHVFRNCPLAKGLGGEPVFQCDFRAYTPNRMMIAVVLVHRPSFGTVRPTLSCFRNTPGDVDPAVAVSVPQLPVREEVRMTGVGKLAWHTPDLAGHDLIVQSAFDELGWNPAEFDTLHLRIEYPALHSVSRMQFPV